MSMYHPGNHGDEWLHLDVNELRRHLYPMMTGRSEHESDEENSEGNSEENEENAEKKR